MSKTRNAWFSKLKTSKLDLIKLSPSTIHSRKKLMKALSVSLEVNSHRSLWSKLILRASLR